MALKNENGNYLKIDGINFHKSSNNSNITIRTSLWESEELRQNPTQFAKAVDKSYHADSDILDIDGGACDASKTLGDNLTTLGYAFLKANGFGEWVDC